MPVFEYQALSADGKTKKGIIEADSERHARQLLREQSLLPNQVKATRDRNKSKNQSASFFAPKLRVRDKVTITRQLANLIRASLPVEEALRTIAEHNNAAIRWYLSATRSRVVEGIPLHQALHEQNIFDNEYTATIASGEKSGTLASILERLAEDVERKEKFNQTLVSAMVYPALILVVSIAVVSSLLVFVVPSIVEAFASNNASLPGLTLAMLSISHFLQANGLYLILGLVMLFALAKLSLRNRETRYKWHTFLSGTPIIGKIFVGSNTAQFSRNLSLMQSSGVPVIEAMQSTARTLSSLPMSDAVNAAIEDIREGSSIYRALEKHKALPAMTLYMLASGEASGNLSDMLIRAAINQENELESFTGALTSVLEPLIILVMGGFVLTIVLSILLPIFELNAAI